MLIAFYDKVRPVMLTHAENVGRRKFPPTEILAKIFFYIVLEVTVNLGNTMYILDPIWCNFLCRIQRFIRIREEILTIPFKKIEADFISR